MIHVMRWKRKQGPPSSVPASVLGEGKEARDMAEIAFGKLQDERPVAEQAAQTLRAARSNLFIDEVEGLFESRRKRRT